MADEFSNSEAQGGQDLLIRIGRVMTAWQGIEYTVCEIYLAFFPVSQRDVPSVAYHAIRTFDARAKVTDAVIKRFCDKSAFAQWDALLTTINKRSTVRNAVAHGPATFFGDAPNRKWGVGVSPYHLEKFQASTSSNAYYTSKELDEANAAMIELTKELDAFRASLERDLKLQSRLLLQQDDALTNARTSSVVAHTQPKP